MAELTSGFGAPAPPKEGRRSTAAAKKWAEIGSTGLEIWSGFISEAYLADLRWPRCAPLFSRIRRSDPEISIVRQVFVALGRSMEISYGLPDEPTSGDLLAQEYGNTALEDIEGGAGDLLEAILSYVPFMGWGWWEIVPGLRRAGWRPPGDDPWRSRYDDGLLGIRRIAFRDHSTFDGWMTSDDGTERVIGMYQQTIHGGRKELPLERAVHLTFGDPINPEGLSPLEAVYRLERIKRGLEIIQGIGFEHSAGHLKIQSEQALTAEDKSDIQKAARAVLTAAEGNYMALPKHIDASIVDVPFAAASSLLEAIKYYGTLKLMVFLSQWVALSATTGTGSFAAKKEDTSMFVDYFNAMVEGFVAQLERQLHPWLFEANREQFGELSGRPKLTVTPLKRTTDLGALTSFVDMLFKVGLDLSSDDIIAIRQASGVLPHSIPAEDEIIAKRPADTGDSVDRSEDEAEDAIPGEGETEVALSRFQAWAKRRAPRLYRMLVREESEDGNDSQ